MHGGTRKIVISALLIAVDVILTRLLAINTPIMKIGLGFAAVALCGAIYGPAWAALTAALADIIGSLLFPTGAYFPGFTLTAALTGVIFGLFLGRGKTGKGNAVLAAAMNTLLVSFLANTAMISYISGADYFSLLAARAIQMAIMFPVQAAVLILFRSSKTIAGLIEKEKAAS